MIGSPVRAIVTHATPLTVAAFAICAYLSPLTPGYSPIAEDIVTRPAADADGRFSLALVALLSQIGPPLRNTELVLTVIAISATGKRSAGTAATSTFTVNALPPPPVDDTPDPPVLVELS